MSNVVNFGAVNAEAATQRYSADAWGRPKSVIDHSVFSATWTFGIPTRVWEQFNFDGSVWTPQVSITDIVVEDKMLSVKSSTTPNHGRTLASKRFSRYQPNRGHIYSTALTMPNPNGQGYRRFGLATPGDGVFFELIGDGTDWDLLAVRRSYGTIVTYDSVKEKLLEAVPDFDPSKGHTYDIQFQWRGVGDYYFFVDMKLVYTEKLLGKLNLLSMSDPALQPFFSSYAGADGNETELKVGCVDVSSEGGVDEETILGTIDSGTGLIALDVANTPTAVLALKMPRSINGDFNSRGVFLDKLVAFCSSADTVTSIYTSRDIAATNVDAIAWTPKYDSNVLLSSGNAAAALNTAFQTDIGSFRRVLNEFTAKDTKTEITNHSKNSQFLATPGDIVVIAGTGLTSTGQLYSATLYFSEQI